MRLSLNKQRKPFIKIMIVEENKSKKNFIITNLHCHMKKYKMYINKNAKFINASIFIGIIIEY